MQKTYHVFNYVLDFHTSRINHFFMRLALSFMETQQFGVKDTESDGKLIHSQPHEKRNDFGA